MFIKRIFPWLSIKYLQQKTIHVQTTKKDLQIPPLRQTITAEMKLNQPLPRDISLPDLTIDGTTFSVFQATSDALWLVEDMVRKAATQGQGFALDEFTPEGHSNRSMLRDNHLLVVKDESSHLVACIIFGSSGAGRGRNPEQVAGYMVVAEDMRSKGVGGRLLQYCMDNAHLLGYTAVITDAFSTDSLPLGMLLRRGFLVTATLPNCGVVAGRSWTNSLLLYKPLAMSNHTPFTPLKVQLKGQCIIIEETTDDDIRAISQLLIHASAAGEGYDKNSYKSEDDVKTFLQRVHHCLKISNADGKIVGIYGITDSSFSRSEKAFYGSGFIYLERSFRGLGLPLQILKDFIPAMLPGKSFLTHTMANGRGLSPFVQAGWTLVGIIPNSVNIPKVGWTHDILVCSSMDVDAGKWDLIDINDLEIPFLKKSIAAEKSLNRPLPRDISLPGLTVHCTTFRVLQATSDDLWVVENMVRKAALQGQGFALDEFTPEGHFNRSMLRDNHLLVAKDESNHFVAALVFGDSKACRGRNPEQVGGYMVVAEDMRSRGVGGRLLQYCMDNAHLLGYTAILTDVFCTDSLPLGMLLRRGFLVTATLPNCGVVAGRGRTNSLLLYKPLLTRKQGCPVVHSNL